MDDFSLVGIYNNWTNKRKEGRKGGGTDTYTHILLEDHLFFPVYSRSNVCLRRSRDGGPSLSIIVRVLDKHFDMMCIC